MEMNDPAIVAALGALAQTHRLAAFRALVQAGEAGMAAGDIAAALGLPPSTLSFHLAQLEAAGLVASTRHGRSLVYAAQFDTMAGLVAYLTDKCCGGAPCAVTQPNQKAKAHA